MPDLLHKIERTPGALLEITYLPPNTNGFTGDLRFNNQRKIIFDGKRYHACYNHAYTFVPCTNFNVDLPPETAEGVFYRRSLPVDSLSGSIMWEPMEYMLNDTTRGGGHTTKRNIEGRGNVFPSMTLRADTTNGGDTIITVVWTAYGGDSAGKGHNVWLRRVHSEDTSVAIAPWSELVGYSAGRDSTVYGTPVISSLAGGELVAWSDSSKGIIARCRKRKPWTSTDTSYTASHFVSRGASFQRESYYPSLPTFSAIRSLDSNVGIVWQQTVPFIFGQLSLIYYGRIVDSSFTRSGSVIDTLATQNYMWISTESAQAFHPSMDLWQDVWHSVYEGVTWDVTQSHSTTGGTAWENWIQFRSLHTETRNGSTPHDSIEATQLWGLAKLRIRDSLSGPRFVYPNTASLNQVYDIADSADSNYFSVAFMDTSRSAMWQSTIRFSLPVFRAGFPAPYIYGGMAANCAASPIRQDRHHAVLYQENKPSPGHSMIHTTRQFFAKARPHGYVANGREVTLRDSSGVGFVGMLHDVWVADDAGAQPVSMTPRLALNTDSLSQVNGLMRTGYFHAHDSVTIGYELREAFFGDSATGVGRSVDFIVQLVDSATGSVTMLLDSFRISPADSQHVGRYEPDCDLVSGTYYVRMLTIPVNTVVLPTNVDSRYPVAELASWVDELPPAKLRRIDAITGAKGRLSVHPNPTSGKAEILFSVPEEGEAAVTIYDAFGRRVVQPLDGMMEPGRYAIDLNAGALPPGTYMVEFRNGENRLVEKLVVVR